ncbi:MAG: winged helix-turn-helix domain-containing protein [Clostridiales bacterium]|nr:winged helix-turn-helix domain-containing protein [Clostridiales bacterium]
MWRNDRRSILVIGANRSVRSQSKKICEDASINCYTTRSSFEALDILYHHQIDGVFVFTGFGHVIELIRTFSTVPCTYVVCGNCIEPGGTDFVLNMYDLNIEDIPDHLNNMIKENLLRTGLKGVIWFNRLRVDMDNYTVVFVDTTIKMKPLEIKLLFYLLKMINRVVSRKRLLADVWEYEQGGETRTLDVHIMALRAMIKKNDLPLQIETIRGEGYKLFDKEAAGGFKYFAQI